MSDHNYGISTFYKGGKFTIVALTNIDLKNILPVITDRPFDIIRYEELNPLEMITICEVFIIAEYLNLNNSKSYFFFTTCFIVFLLCKPSNL
jgi:hypothetical protein